MQRTRIFADMPESATSPYTINSIAAQLYGIRYGTRGRTVLLSIHYFLDYNVHLRLPELLFL